MSAKSCAIASGQGYGEVQTATGFVGCCLNAKGRSAEDVAEDGWMRVSVCLLRGRVRVPANGESCETGGENARSRRKAATSNPYLMYCNLNNAMGGILPISLHPTKYRQGLG
jgi:hypothetical protein